MFKGKNGSFHYIDWGRNGPLAHFSHAHMQCFKNTSHFVPMEKPEETARAIQAFVKAYSLDKSA